MKFDLNAIKKNAQKRWKVIAIAVVLLAAAGWYFLSASANNTPEQTFITPEEKSLTQTLEISGVVDAKEKARMRFAAGGLINGKLLPPLTALPSTNNSSKTSTTTSRSAGTGKILKTISKTNPSTLASAGR